MNIEIIRIDESLGKLVYELFDKYRVFYKQPSDMAIARRFIQERLYQNDSVIFVALEKGTPVGFTQLYPTYSSLRVTRNWILNDLYVEETHRKRGIGESLIRTALEYARSVDAKYVQLSTAVDNHTAQRLYEQVGFVKQEPETDFFTYRMGVK